MPGRPSGAGKQKVEEEDRTRAEPQGRAGDTGNHGR